MKKRVKRSRAKPTRKKGVKRVSKKPKKAARKVKRVFKKRQSKKEKNLLLKLEHAAKKRGVSLFTYVRMKRFKKNKNY
jgi:hypothetical protein